MFDELQSAGCRFRRYAPRAASLLAHLGVLAAIVFHRPAVIQLAPAGLAYGNSAHSYRVVYLAPGGEDTDPDPKLSFSPNIAPRRTKSSSPQTAHDRLPVAADAEVADHPSRAGSALGTMIDGPIAGHEVRVAYPVVFPDPPVARAEIPADLQGDVIVEVTIDTQGYVVETRVLAAIGHGIDEKVVAALRQWRFQPATLDGTPVASKHDVHFHFPS
jgi:TonB family protein